MKLLTVLLCIFIASTTYSQKLDVVGTWDGYEVLVGNPKKTELADSSSFKSTLSMNSDSTFTLVTSGFEVVMGKFTAGPNFIILFKLVGFEDYERYWDIRWVKGKDPYPDTEAIDFMIPTQANMRNKKKNTVSKTQVYVLFKKVE